MSNRLRVLARKKATENSCYPKVPVSRFTSITFSNVRQRKIASTSEFNTHFFRQMENDKGIGEEKDDDIDMNADILIDYMSTSQTFDNVLPDASHIPAAPLMDKDIFELQEQHETPLADATSEMPKEKKGAESYDAEPDRELLVKLNKNIEALHETLKKEKRKKDTRGDRSRRHNRSSDNKSRHSRRRYREESDGSSSDEDSDCSYDSRGRKLHRGYTPRKRPAVNKATAVRLHTMFLMNREAPDDPLPAPPTQEQMDRHQRRGDNSGPTLEFFRIDYNAKPTSKWNRAATVVFVDTFLKTPESRRYFQYEAQSRNNEDDYARKLHIKATKNEVQRTFRKHFHSLRRKWAKQNEYDADEDAHAIDKSSAARDRRRRELYNRRRALTENQRFQNLGLEKFFKLFEFLGADGMSSDESCVEETLPPKYTIYKREWRSPELTLLFREFDALHCCTRLDELGRYKKGNIPHKRVNPVKEHVSTRGVVLNLPINCYNTKWLDSLLPEEREVINPDPVQTDLSRSDTMIQLARRWLKAVE